MQTDFDWKRTKGWGRKSRYVRRARRYKRYIPLYRGWRMSFPSTRPPPISWMPNCLLVALHFDRCDWRILQRLARAPRTDGSSQPFLEDARTRQQPLSHSMHALYRSVFQQNRRKQDSQTKHLQDTNAIMTFELSSSP